ncbi:nf kappa B inhibitor I-kappa-B [Aspergillus arachidicola]|uniref:Nf kappa B inhibitor I-kappa-B n=1 Tax=Aspergillus arachidicola TaxID=656916 RepID=A0A2G7FEQ7_9EURO|nr:nf kappa B inhibitor I-kappa-B [Aspergillus arachidicola]
MSPDNQNHLLGKLCPGDSTAERQETLSCERVGTLGNWFLKDKLTQDWINGSGLQVLWAYGPAATGKTYISSLVVDHIRSEESRPGIAVFYFDDAHPQYNVADFGVAFRSIARQLMAQIIDPPADIIDLAEGYSAFHSLDGGKPAGLWSLITSSFESVFVVFDAINASEAALKDMLVYLAGNDAQNSCLHILITSRYPPPRSLLRTYELLTVAMRASDDDLMTYIMHELGDLSDEKHLSSMPKDAHETMSAVIELLDGVFPPLPRFRAISDTLDELAQVLSNEPSSEKSRALSQLALGHIGKAEHRKNTIKVLHLVSTLEEIGYKPTIPQVVDFLPFLGFYKTDDNPYTTDDVANMCTGFVSLSTRTQTMRIRSSLLQSYLNEEASKSNTKVTMLRAALSYLSQDAFQSGACTSSASLKKRFQTHPFLPFAARIISLYTSRVPHQQEALDDFLRFASNRGSIDSYLQAADAWPYQDDDSYDELESAEQRWAYFPRGYGPLHVAAHIVGGRLFVKALLQQGEDVEAKSRNGQTALHVAAGIEHESQTVRTLLEYGANVSAVDDDRETPLSIAVVEGSLETIKLLVEFGADVRSLDTSILVEYAEERRDVVEYLTGLG